MARTQIIEVWASSTLDAIDRNLPGLMQVAAGLSSVFAGFALTRAAVAWAQGLPVVAAPVAPGWHPCAVPESGSSAAGWPRRGVDAAASRPFEQSVERSFTAGRAG